MTDHNRYHKDLRPLIKRLRAEGWTVEKTRGGHVRFLDPEGVCVTIVGGSPKSPGLARISAERDINRHRQNYTKE